MKEKKSINPTIVVLAGAGLLICLAVAVVITIYMVCKVDYEKKIITQIYLKYDCPKSKIKVKLEGENPDYIYYDATVCGVRQRWRCDTSAGGRCSEAELKEKINPPGKHYE